MHYILGYSTDKINDFLLNLSVKGTNRKITSTLHATSTCHYSDNVSTDVITYGFDRESWYSLLVLVFVCILSFCKEIKFGPNNKKRFKK